MPGTDYNAAVIGKWHISQPADPNHPEQHGVDYYMGYLSGAPASYTSWSKTYAGVTQNETDYVTSVITDSAIQWIDRQTKPWFLWLTHGAPHTPYHVPPAHLHSQTNTNGNIRNYFAMIEALDTEIGRLLNSMSQAERDNTIIIYMGDNGTPSNVMRNYPSGRGKGSLYQGGINVPFIVSGKGVSRKGQREDALISVNDLHATILELSGRDLAGGLNNSLSFKHLLSGTTGPTKDYNYIDYSMSGQLSWTIRNSRYKLIEDANGNQQFYDLMLDSFELTNKLLSPLSSQDSVIKADLEKEAASIRTSWSCRDHIQNGDEEGIDCGGTFCDPCNPNRVDNLKAAIHIYPNPSESVLHIVAGNQTFLGIYNLLGNEVYVPITYDKDRINLNITALPVGMYIVRTSLGIAKFIKN